MTPSTRRTLSDRVLERLVPRPDTMHTPPPEEVCAGLHVLDRRLRHFGTTLLPSRTTLLRLADGSLVVISPPPIDDAAVEAILRIGPVRQVVAPSSFHHLYAAAFARRFPGASLVAPASLRTRLPDLSVDVVLGSDEPEGWAGALEYRVLTASPGVCEALFFHVPTSTLVLTDLAFNMVRYPRPIDRWIWRMAGVPRAFGPGRTTRNLLLTDEAAATAVLRDVARWPIRRIVVAHGDIVEEGALERFRAAFAGYLERDRSADVHPCDV